ncbi:hypothetical protein CRE_11420 [Caenorhabditis remanei]|uniref:DUF38 domain-containing protein n=1 Tax=Caenorhabditis remanei TaxID=31234 RepID=E3NBD0_CAERE|nr:hypothetical protein CRE_11420 [Caenorhabditis remanei]
MEIIEEELRKSRQNFTNRNGTIDLSLLAPESLEEVSLFINEKSVKKMNEILQSWQYKRLKMLTIRTNLSPWDFPLESFIGYPRFTIKLRRTRAELKVAEFIKVIADFVQKHEFFRKNISTTRVLQPRSTETEENCVRN